MSQETRFSNPGMLALACAAILSVALAVPAQESERQGVSRQRSQAPPPPPTGTATVTVNVVGAEDGSAVKGVRLTLLALQTAEAAAPSGRPGIQLQTIAPRDRVGAAGVRTMKPGRTNAGGVVTFSDLPGGTYSVLVQPPPGYVTREQVPALRVADGSQASATIKLSRGGVLTGRVFDEDGDPVTGAYISVYRVPRLGGRPQQGGYGGLQPTNDLGVYRVWGLQAGDYVVSTSYDDRQPQPADSIPADGYVPTYYPSVAALDQARPVQVRPGQETGGVDIQLLRGRLGSVQVRVLDSAGSPAVGGLSGGAGAAVSLTPRGNSPTQQSIRTLSSEGLYVISKVPAGDYYLSAMVMRGSGTAGVREGAYVPVSVNGDEVSVTLQTNLGATVSGRVVLEGVPPAQAGSPGAGARPPSIRVMAQPASASSLFGLSTSSPAVVRPDGTFTLTGVRGPVQFTASGGRAALKSVRRGMDEIAGRPIELLGTERIDDLVITMTYDTGMLRGDVLVDSSQPTAAASVLVLPDDPEKWSPGSPFVRWSRAASTESAARSLSARTPGTAMTGQPAATTPGSFQVDSLPPGRYLVLAFADGNTFSIVDPPAIERLRELGKVVTVDTGQTAAVKVEAIK